MLALEIISAVLVLCALLLLNAKRRSGWIIFAVAMLLFAVVDYIMSLYVYALLALMQSALNLRGWWKWGEK